MYFQLTVNGTDKEYLFQVDVNKYDLHFPDYGGKKCIEFLKDGKTIIYLNYESINLDISPFQIFLEGDLYQHEKSILENLK